MRSDWAYVHDTIERTFSGTKLSLIPDEEICSFLNALDCVFEDVVYENLRRRLLTDSDDVTPGAQGA